MSPFGLKFSQMILHTETSKLMYNWSFLFEVLHKPTLLPSTFNKILVKILQNDWTHLFLLLSQRLQALDDGWSELHQMWDNRQLLLSQALNYQMFQRDARQADSILNQQENFLTKVEQPVSASIPSLANLTIFSHTIYLQYWLSSLHLYYYFLS